MKNGCRFKHSVAELRAQPATEKDGFKALLDKRLADHQVILAAVNSQCALTGFNWGAQLGEEEENKSAESMDVSGSGFSCLSRK